MEVDTLNNTPINIDQEYVEPGNLIADEMCSSDAISQDTSEENENLMEYSYLSNNGDGGGSCVVVTNDPLSSDFSNENLNGNNLVNNKLLNGALVHSNLASVSAGPDHSLINNSVHASTFSLSDEFCDPRGQLNQLSSDLLIPSNHPTDLSDIVSDNNQEIIAISDEEEFLESANNPQPQPSILEQSLFNEYNPGSIVSKSYPMNFTPMPAPMSLPMSMPPPPPLRQMFPRSLGGPNDVITLSDDDEDDIAAQSSSVKTSRKLKRSSRNRKAPMFDPKICPFCYKPKRENICMSKHLISRHWARIRASNMGTSKATDYANIKDDREIPVEKYKEEKHSYRRSPPMSPYLPSSLSGPSTSQMYSRPNLIEQPLRPSFLPSHARGAFSRPPVMSGTVYNGPGGSSSSFGGPSSTVVMGPSKEEPKSLGQEMAEELGHPSKRKLVQAQLGLLMHAHKCNARGSLRKQNSFFQEEKTCTLPDCSQTKELLRHLPTCSAETDCPVQKCFMSKQIIKWALSPETPDMMRDNRSELHRQAKSGLPKEVIAWASQNKIEKQQWKTWRENKPLASSQSNPILESLVSEPTTIKQVQNFPVSIDITNDASIEEPSVTEQNKQAQAQTDWKQKYLKARERMKGNQIAQKMKNAPKPIEDKIVQSQASADILSSLLSAQSEVADLRKVRRPGHEQGESSKGKKVPKLIPAPVMEGGANGEEAAKYNSMLSL